MAKGIRRLVGRPNNGYGRGGRNGFSTGKLGKLRGAENPRGGTDIGVRVRGRR